MILIFALALHVTAVAEVRSSEGEGVVQKYVATKELMVESEQKSREIMSTLYQINRRMNEMSKKRDALNNRMIGVESKMRVLGKSVAELELKIASQRNLLSKRLRAIYMLGEQGVARILFSSASSHDLDQSLKYLKKISERDYKLIKSYEDNLTALNIRKEKIRAEAARLARIRGRLQKQEDLLSSDQKSKAKILSDIKKMRDGAITELTQLRAEAIRSHVIDAYDLSFFEQKGELLTPVQGQLALDFSLIENELYGYKLSHKGHTYNVSPNSFVTTVYKGRVSFVGEIPGYGNTVVVSHGDHYYTVYSHADDVIVEEGQTVATRDKLAKAHTKLYFEIRHFSDPIDPKLWLKRAQI